MEKQKNILSTKQDNILIFMNVKKETNFFFHRKKYDELEKKNRVKRKRMNILMARLKQRLEAEELKLKT